MRTRIQLTVPTAFRFAAVVFSHGWSTLGPFTVKKSSLILTRIVRMRSDALATLEISGPPGTGVRGNNPRIVVHSASPLRERTLDRMKALAASMMQTGLDLSPFYERIRGNSRFAWAEQAGAGRMLRGETFFEDAVKTILTTNCSWAMTVSMNNNLINHFGPKNRLGYNGFPSPHAIADSSIAYLRRECRLGYRADYVHELAVRSASGLMDIEAFRVSTAPSDEIFRELCAIKGIGEYAAANLMRMLGKFDYLGLDSWCRNKIAEIHGKGVPLTDADIKTLYQEFDEWKGLAMWLDVTRHWYLDGFPLHE